jgi:hypothetical protein
MSSILALAQEIENSYEEISVEQVVGGYWNVYVERDLGQYWDTVPGEVLDVLVSQSDVTVYDRHTGQPWEG